MLSFINGRPMVAGRATAADGIITLAGAVNAITEYEGYKLVNDEAVIAARPDAVLVMQRATVSSRRQEVFAHPAFATTPAAARKALRLDGGSLSPRLRSARGARRRAISPSRSIRRWRRADHGPKPCRAGDAADRLIGMTQASPRIASAPDRRGAQSMRRAGRSPVLLVAALADGGRRRNHRRGGHSARPPGCGARPGDGDPARIDRDRLVLWSIRLPRIALAVMIGGLLAAAGAIMQGLFRNPLADPALVGVSSGAASGGCGHDRGRGPLSGGDRRHVAVRGVAARGLRRRAGGDRWSSIASRPAKGAPRSPCSCSAGLAIAALANAGVGLLVFLADDRQLRDINFLDARLARRRDLGEGRGDRAVSGGRRCLRVPFIARGLDLLVLGESEAFHSGVAVERLKRICDRAGGRGDRRRGVGRGRDRVRRHRRAASAAAADRAGPPPAAAGGRAARRRPAAGRRHVSRARSRRPPNCRSASSPR